MSSDPGRVVIPAYQAERTIGPIVRAVVAQGLPVLVVDDASTDRTAQEAERAGARVVRRSRNGGKGTALREGLSEACEGAVPWVITMDADGQHLPVEIPLLLRAAQTLQADLVIGDRMKNPREMPLERRWTNQFMSWIISRVTGQRIPDTSVVSAGSPAGSGTASGFPPAGTRLSRNW